MNERALGQLASLTLRRVERIREIAPALAAGALRVRRLGHLLTTLTAAASDGSAVTVGAVIECTVPASCCAWSLTLAVAGVRAAAPLRLTPLETAAAEAAVRGLRPAVSGETARSWVVPRGLATRAFGAAGVALAGPVCVELLTAAAVESARPGAPAFDAVERRPRQLWWSHALVTEAFRTVGTDNAGFAAFAEALVPRHFRGAGLFTSAASRRECAVRVEHLGRMLNLLDGARRGASAPTTTALLLLREAAFSGDAARLVAAGATGADRLQRITLRLETLLCLCSEPWDA